MVKPKPLTCEQVDQEELDRRYVQGRLSEADAAAFEEHFFGCDRCWRLVKGGGAVRAALAKDAVPVGRTGSLWKPLAMAAGIGLVALGIWEILAARRTIPDDEMRGSADSLVVHSRLSAGTWHLSWSPVPGATAYQVRISSADGALLDTRQVTDTILDLPAARLAPDSTGAPSYLEVLGFDLLRRPVARSPLVPLSNSP